MFAQDICTPREGTSPTDPERQRLPSVTGMNLMAEHTATTARPRTGRSSDRTRRPAVIVLAAVAAGFLWVLAVPVLGVDLEVAGQDGDARRIGLGAVIASALAAGLAGWGLLALLSHLTPRGGRIWSRLAGLVALVSLTAPLTMAESTPAVLTLGAMHLAVGLVLVAGLPQRSGWARR